jgi:hypothetical protein
MKHTTSSFRKNQLLQSALAETLAAPHVQIALQVLRDLGEPAEMPVPPEVDFLSFNAMQNARREGYFHAVRALEILATPPSKTHTTKDLMPNLVEED